MEKNLKLDSKLALRCAININKTMNTEGSAPSFNVFGETDLLARKQKMVVFSDDVFPDEHYK